MVIEIEVLPKKKKKKNKKFLDVYEPTKKEIGKKGKISHPP